MIGAAKIFIESDNESDTLMDRRDLQKTIFNDVPRDAI